MIKKTFFILVTAFNAVAFAQTTTPVQPNTFRVDPPQPVDAPRIEVVRPKPAPATTTVPAPTPVPPTSATPAPAQAAPAAPAKSDIAPALAAQPEQQVSGTDIPSLNRPNPASFNARLAVGPAFSPNALWFDVTLEAQLDKFLAIGPKIQFGTNSTTDFFFASLGPRFTIPFYYFEAGLNGGFGFAYRNLPGFEFTNFLYEAGFSLDFFILKNLSIGAAYNANFITSSAETFMSAIVFSLAGHF